MKIAVKVTPRAKRNALDRTTTPWKIRVTAPPVDQAANQAVRQLVADQLGLPVSAVAILQGHASRLKLIEIPNGVVPEQPRLLEN